MNILRNSIILPLTLIGFSAQATEYRKTSETFIKPLKLEVISADSRLIHPEFCNKLSSRTRCPDIVSNDGASGGVLLPDPWVGTGYKNVRVSVYVSDITNTVVDNGGVETELDDDFEFIEWYTTSPEADLENTGPYGWSLPGPGQTYDQFGPHGSASGLRVYDALVLGACGSLSSFDISHDADISEDALNIGSFSASDNSTINNTGYYNMEYIVRASDSDGGVSDFVVRGEVHVLCTGLNSL